MIFDSLLLKLNPYMLFIKITAIALVFLSGCYVTRLYYVNKLEAQIIATQKAEAVLAAKGSDIQVKFIKDTQTVEVKGKDRIIKVIEYVPQDLVTNGFVEYHNAAVDNRDLMTMTPDEASKISQINQQQVATVVSKNYVTCNKYILQIEALQNFLREIEKTYNE